MNQGAASGFDADPTALDGQWGFFSVMGEGFDAAKAKQGFGQPLTIESPGVSIKPYPSGILTHQSMDAMLKLVLDNDLKPEDVERIRFFAGRNIIEPIRYPIARNHLQAKFSMIVLCRRASHHEFENAFVAGEAMQDLQARTAVINDPEIDARGYDLIRSRIEVDTKDRRTPSNGRTSVIAAARSIRSATAISTPSSACARRAYWGTKPRPNCRAWFAVSTKARISRASWS